MCIWRREYSFSEDYNTECGKSITLEKNECNITPKDKEYRFCPFCGNEIEAIEAPNDFERVMFRRERRI